MAEARWGIVVETGATSGFKAEGSGGKHGGKGMGPGGNGALRRETGREGEGSGFYFGVGLAVSPTWRIVRTPYSSPPFDMGVGDIGQFGLSGPK